MNKCVDMRYEERNDKKPFVSPDHILETVDITPRNPDYCEEHSRESHCGVGDNGELGNGELRAGQEGAEYCYQV